MNGLTPEQIKRVNDAAQDALTPSDGVMDMINRSKSHLDHLANEAIRTGETMFRELENKNRGDTVINQHIYNPGSGVVVASNNSQNISVTISQNLSSFEEIKKLIQNERLADKETVLQILDEMKRAVSDNDKKTLFDLYTKISAFLANHTAILNMLNQTCSSFM